MITAKVVCNPLKEGYKTVFEEDFSCWQGIYVTLVLHLQDTSVLFVQHKCSTNEMQVLHKCPASKKSPPQKQFYTPP